MFCFEIEALKRNGGIEYSEHLLDFAETSISSFRPFEFFYSGPLALESYRISQLRDVETVCVIS